MFQIDLQLLARLRQIVCEEDIAGLGDLVEQLLPLFGRDIDADRPFAAIGVLHQRAALRIDREPLQHLDAALRIAAHRVLDLDDVGTPVGEHCAGRGDEGELRHLEHPHALHNLGHSPSPFQPAWKLITFW